MMAGYGQNTRSGRGGGHGGYGGYGGGHGQGGKAQVGPATAPYNFIPYDPTIIVPPDPAGDPDAGMGDRWSGEIVCSLKALTPLLVAGPQAKAAKDDGPKERRFLSLDGRPVIPGTSLKGMLRSLVEILSFSHMSPVNARKMFWRNVTGKGSAEYKQIIGDELRGGFLRREGSRCTLEPADVRRGIGPEAYQTGPMRGKTQGYIFERRENAPRWDVPPKVMEDFLDQMTDDQETRWKPEERNLKSGGARVFYTGKNGVVTALGTARCFRVAYKYTVADLIGPRPEEDFATRLFGRVEGGAIRGRVSVGAASFTKHSFLQPPVVAILGTPHPTCLLHYLEQPGARPSGNRRDDLVAYNHEGARLRGRKLYWHRDFERPDEASMPPSMKVRSRLHPLDRGATAEFRVRLDRVTDMELGAILEALDLPEGHAHRLGAGRPLGMGSVRIDVKDVLVEREAERWTSLRARLGGSGPASLPADARERCRAAFREHVEKEAARLSGKPRRPYEELEAIRALRRMTDFDGRPPNEATRTMPLNRDGGEPNFARSGALLPQALKVPGRRTPSPGGSGGSRRK